MSRYDWMESALCAQTDPDLFHVEGSGGGYNTGKKICASCPVQLQCGNFAQATEGDIAYSRRYGLWGGQLPRARAKQGGGRPRNETHEIILRLHDRGGMDAYEIAKHADVDPRTVWRVIYRRDQLGEAA